MSSKRSRVKYEADLTAKQSPYVLYGTPLPPDDPEVQDDGSYVPVWKQEVKDERGRKRLHGAFTGGFSAGYELPKTFNAMYNSDFSFDTSYFNSVGSKEGWTPSTFVSSRKDRRKDDPNAPQQQPEDFMDEEDLAEAEESRKIQINPDFAGFGSAEGDASRTGGLMGLLRPTGETVGTRLLKKMGWKEGEGIGPKIRRIARLGLQNEDGADTFLFAPKNIPVVKLAPKTDTRGLGFRGQVRLRPHELSTRRGSINHSDDDDDIGFGRPKFSLSTGRKKDKGKSRGGIGIGVLNDTGSDDEDPYEIGPRISYNRVIGGDKKKKKKTATIVNPSVATKPVFKPSKSSALGKVALGVRRCHDGRLPLDGFVFGKRADPLLSEVNSKGKYPPPKIPLGWVSKKYKSSSQPKARAFLSTKDAAKASTLDPKARAALLGEKQLPGKSVFDYMTPAARERLVSLTGKTDLPPARGEKIPGVEPRGADDQFRRLDKDTAIGAIKRATSGSGTAPYADNPEKLSRYRAYLEYHAGYKPSLPKPPQMKPDEWLRETDEFFSCARIFKPMSGLMASRFTTSSTVIGQGGEKVFQPPAKPKDPAEEAAKLGMFGPLTRSTAEFLPCHTLCQRFNVKRPARVQPDNHKTTSTSRFWRPAPSHIPGGPPTPPNDQRTLAELINDVENDPRARNDTLERAAASEAALKAIFGDSDAEN